MEFNIYLNMEVGHYYLRISCDGATCLYVERCGSELRGLDLCVFGSIHLKEINLIKILLPFWSLHGLEFKKTGHLMSTAVDSLPNLPLSNNHQCIIFLIRFFFELLNLSRYYNNLKGRMEKASRLEKYILTRLQHRTRQMMCLQNHNKVGKAPTEEKSKY